MTTVAVSGASGLVGRALVAALADHGNQVRRLVRREPADRAAEIHWDPAAGKIDAGALAGVDAVVHLAGENIADGRWTAAKKERIRASRVEGTRLLCETLASLDHRPRVLAAASAIGFYGDRGEAVMEESAAVGDGFLAEVCRQWEEATQPAAEAGIRVVNLRIGVVLSADGGALAKMLLPFKMGGGGVVGSGRQIMSWVAIDDVAAAVRHVLGTESLRGPVNLVAPQPVTNREFTKTLGRVLRRPTVVPMPAAVARLAFGEMADELLLSSTHVQPARLLESGYAFAYPELEGALRHVLGRE